MTKTEITNKLNTLRKIFGVNVYHFNHNHKMPTGSIGWADHIITTNNYIIVIEDKLGKDKLSKKQSDLKNAIRKLEKIKDSRIKYYLNADDINYITNEIITFYL